jgi:hypothetical protein
MKRFLIHLILLVLLAPSAILMVMGATWLRLVRLMPKPKLSKNKVDSYSWFEALFNWIDDYVNP